jgi:hypothetical protein
VLVLDRCHGIPTSYTKIVGVASPLENLTQLTCRGAPGGYPRVEELAILSTGARCEYLYIGERRERKAPAYYLWFTPVNRITNSLVKGTPTG